MNDFLIAARAKKVAAFVAYFDTYLPAVQLDPNGDAAAIAAGMMSMSPAVWEHHAAYAGQNKPSSDTIAAIVAVYSERGAARAERVKLAMEPGQ